VWAILSTLPQLRPCVLLTETVHERPHCPLAPGSGAGPGGQRCGVAPDATGHATFYETALNTGPAERCTRPAGVCSTSLAGSAFVLCAKQKQQQQQQQPPCLPLSLSLSLLYLLLHLRSVATPSQRQRYRPGQGRKRLANRHSAIVEWSSACLLTAVARSPIAMAFAARLVLLVTVVSALAGQSGTHARS
jgi:hypothetical protein